MSTATELQYICDETGETVAVIVPISLWQEIASDRETAYLLQSEAMKHRKSLRHRIE